jgi:hemoglobin-like flavoprotein
MSHTNIAIQFNESFERYVNNPFFLDSFYELFLSSSDEVRLMFKDTEMEIQKVMLATSMAYMTAAYNSKSDLLSKIADKHNKNNLNINPHLYPLWLDSLIAAAKSIEPLFDMDTEKLWRKIMQPGIDHMISRYSGVL